MQCLCLVVFIVHHYNPHHTFQIEVPHGIQNEEKFKKNSILHFVYVRTYKRRVSIKFSLFKNQHTLWKLPTPHYTMHKPHCTNHTAHFTIQTSNYSKYIAHCTLNTSSWKLYSAQCIPHISLCKICTIHSASTLHSIQTTVHTRYFTLHTRYFTLHTEH